MTPEEHRAVHTLLAAAEALLRKTGPGQPGGTRRALHDALIDAHATLQFKAGCCDVHPGGRSPWQGPAGG